MTAAATFCATFVDEWVRAGVTDAVVAPGSRSTPLALALADAPELRVHVVHDERSASFIALGLGRVTGRPAPLLCTSGTAAAHFHAAVIEADLSAVPMLVCTADRPPELWDTGAPQTIDQTRLYGDVVRWFCEPGPPEDTEPSTWRALASRGFASAAGWSAPAGPVHYNLSFREPLVGEPDRLPEGRGGRRPWTEPPAQTAEGPASPDVAALAETFDRADGIVVAGGGTPDPGAVVDLAERLDWPLIADHRSGCRVPGRSIAHADLLLRTERFAGRRPATILRFGEPHASKVLSGWLAGAGAEVIAATPAHRHLDPERIADRVIPAAGLAPALLDLLGGWTAAGGRTAEWNEADRLIEGLLDRQLTAGPVPTEPGIARTVVDTVPAGGVLVVASSMPVRDVEWYGRARADLDVIANRGANGIDGVTSTAIGVALGGRPTIGLLGDLAFLHDSAALTALASRAVDLTIVVVDNDGGGIFSFLPQASRLPPPRFEALFGTPHGTDLDTLAAAHHLPAEPWAGADLAPDGVRVVIARTDRAENVEAHRRVERLVSAAIDGGP